MASFSSVATTGDWTFPGFISGYGRDTHVGDELVFDFPGIEIDGFVNAERWTGPHTATLIVEQAGLTTLTFERWDKGHLRKRAFFAISARAGTAVELPYSDNVDPEEVRLGIDYNADGDVDAELSPMVFDEGDKLDTAIRWIEVDAQVEQIGSGRVLVGFAPTERSVEPAGIYYTIYPSQSQLQMYTEPFEVDEGSFMLYGAVAETGQRQDTKELELLGGIAEDIRLQASIDGQPVEASTTVPGQ